MSRFYLIGLVFLVLCCKLYTSEQKDAERDIINEDVRTSEIIEDKISAVRNRHEEITDIGDWKIIDKLDKDGRSTGETVLVKDEYGQFLENATERVEKPLRVRVTVKKNSYSGQPTVYVDFDEYDNGSYEESAYGNRWHIECDGVSYAGDWDKFQIDGNKGFVSANYLLSIEKRISFFAGVGYSKIYRFSFNPYGYRNALLKAGIVE